MSKFKDYTDGIDAYEYLGGMRGGGKTLMQKGLLYEKLSEELGCPLEVVFKALEEGIHIQAEFLNLPIKDFIEIPHLFFSDNFKRYYLITRYGSHMLQDYQKTWWLKGENNEKM